MALLRSALAGALLLLSLSTAAALELPYRHRLERVQAAYLYNFARFVTWPDASFTGADSPLTLAIADPRLLEAAAEVLAGRTVHGRPLVVRQPGEGDDARRIHLLFVADGDPRRGEGVLTVGDRPGFAAAGGHIEMIKRGERLRFGINLEALRRDKLAISSEVLSLAEFVLGSEGEGP